MTDERRGCRRPWIRTDQRGKRMLAHQLEDARAVRFEIMGRDIQTIPDRSAEDQKFTPARNTVANTELVLFSVAVLENL